MHSNHNSNENDSHRRQHRSQARIGARRGSNARTLEKSSSQPSHLKLNSNSTGDLIELTKGIQSAFCDLKNLWDKYMVPMQHK